MNKVQRKFPLDMCYLFEIFPAIRLYYSDIFRFLLYAIVKVGSISFL